MKTAQNPTHNSYSPSLACTSQTRWDNQLLFHVPLASEQLLNAVLKHSHLKVLARPGVRSHLHQVMELLLRAASPPRTSRLTTQRQACKEENFKSSQSLRSAPCQTDATSSSHTAARKGEKGGLCWPSDLLTWTWSHGERGLRRRIWGRESGGGSAAHVGLFLFHQWFFFFF